MATKNVFDRFDQPEQPKKGANVFDNFDGQTKATSAARYLADTGVAGAQGLVSGVQMLSNVAGADNAVSRGLGTAVEKLGTLQSPYRKAEQQNRQRLIDTAEKSGSTWEEIKANVGAFAEAPIDTTVNALGTSAPTMAAAMLTGGAAAPVVLGAAQGAGAVKGSIYDSVQSKLRETGTSEEEAARRAGQAQAYTSDNAAQIALGAGLGALAGSTGAESAIARMAAATAGKKAAKDVAKEAGDLTMGSVAKAAGVGALKEAPLEMLQGGQERVAGNIAQQNEGFDTPTFQGAVGQAALEGLASAPIGGGFGAMERLSQAPRASDPAPQPDQPGTNPPAAPPQALGYNPRAGTITVFPDGSAVLDSDTPAGEAAVFEKRFAPQPIKPSETMGINPADGVLSRVAADAVDTGVTAGIQAAEQAALAAQQAEDGQPAQDELPEISLEDADENDRLAYQAYMASLAEDQDADAMVRQALGDDPEVTLDATNNTTEEDFLRALGASEQEIADAIAANPAPSRQPTAADAGADAAAQPGSAVDGRAAAGPAGDAGIPADAGPDLTATSLQRSAGAAPDVAADPQGSTQQPAQGSLTQPGNVQDAPQGAARTGGPVVNEAASAQAAPVEAPAPAAGNAAAAGGVPNQGGRPDVQAAGVSPGAAPRPAIAEATDAAKKALQEGGTDQDAMRAATDALIARMDGEPGISISADAPAAVQAAKAEPPAAAQPTKAELDKLEVPNMTDDQLRAGLKVYGAVTKRATKIRKEIQKRGLDAQSPAPTQENPNGPQAPEAQQAAPQGREETTLLPDSVSTQPGAQAQAEPSPLVKALNDLAEVNARIEQQGRVVDDRLVERQRKLKAMVKDLEREQKPAAPAPAAEDSTPTAAGPYARWRDSTPAQRRELLRAAGYTDADQARGLSGTDWGQLTDPVRRALSAAPAAAVPAPPRAAPGVKAAGGVIDSAYVAPAQALVDRFMRDEITRDELFDGFRVLNMTLGQARSVMDRASDKAGWNLATQDAYAASVQKPAATPAPAAAQAEALTEREKAAKAKMFNALGKLAALASKNTRMNWTQEEEQQLLPIVIELFDGAMELGAVKFKQAVAYVREFIANGIDQETADAIPFETLQGAYIAVAGRHKDKPVTPKKEVAGFESLDELNAQEDNDTPENTNGQPAVRQPGAQALDPAPTQQGGGAAPGGDAGAGPADRGQPDAGADSGADGAGVSAPRGGGSRAGRVPSAASRGGRGGGRRGTGGDGTRVPRADARATGAPGAVPEPVGDLFAGGAESASAPNIPAANFKIDESLSLGSGGEAAKFRDNIAAIETLKAIEAERRRATPEEQRVLARFVGWGGLASAFPNPETGKFKDGWQEKGEQLRNLLTPSEYRAASRSTRNAHYTSSTVVKAMWSAVRRMGYRAGLALETSMGVGNFLGLMPDNVAARFIGVEYDALTARMAKALYPQATVLQAGFQEVPLPDNVFDLSIGNPPFGDESLRFQYRPELRGESIHNQFFRASMSSLKPGGLQAMVVSRYLMDKQDRATRIALAREAELVAAIRLPDTAFKENARTEVVTDIIILRKRDTADRARMEAILDAYTGPKEKAFDKERERQELAAQAPAWIETAEMADPLGGEPMVVNSYFLANPGQVVGVMERSGSMRYKNDVTVRLDNPESLGERLDALVAKLPENIVSPADDVAQATEQNYKLLGEALSMAVAREEAGHIKFDEDGGLTRAVEREFGDGVVLTRQPLTAESPWSKQLFMDGQGRWYKLEVKVDDAGKPVKLVKDGKPTRLNVYDRTVYQSEADIPSGLRLGETGLARLKGLVGLRDLLKRQLVLETEDAPKVMMEGNRDKLAKAYEAFVAEHGPINRRANAALVTEMPDGGLVLALEESYEPERTAAQAKKSGLPEQSESAKPAPIMRERVVPKYDPPTKAETPADALAITLAERGIVDIDRIAALLEITPEQAAERLQDGEKPLIFKDPESGLFETANAYLSGHVRRKLNAAKAAGLQKNVAALEAIQPERWGAENVTVQMGASWVPPDVYADFGAHLLGGNVKVSFSPVTNTFAVTASGSDQTKADAWSSEGAPAGWIYGRLLNSQSPVVTRVDAEGKTYIDKESTSLAILKSREMVAEFGDWVFKDSARRERLVEIFNEKFNTRVTRQFDGSHLKLPGKVPDSIIKMRRHQMNAIWRGISSRFLLIDHVVGAGKTFTAIARAMERRRMGLAQKPAIVVPNHLIEQWQADVYKLYPGAKVLAASKADFEMKNRRKLFSRIATGDYDVVILPHSSLVKIGISPETEQRYLEQELQEAIQAVKDAQEQAEEDGHTGFRKPMGVKEAERLVAKIERRMATLREAATDRLLTFEQLGIDDLTVDEAHEFKNLFYSSRMTGTRGMGDKTGSLKASDLYNKVRVLRDNNGSVVFMTGTPVSNSVVELYTMMRYLASSDLRDMGMEHFDAWRAQFVEATPAFEPDEANRLKEVTRLGRTWSNMRAMMDLYYQFTDAVSIDDIKTWYAEDNGGKAFPVPKVKGGDRQLVKMQPTAAQEAMLKEVLAGFDGLEGIKDPKERNAERLRLMDRARKLSLDARAADRRTTSTEKGGKLERVSAEVKRIYDKWTADRGTQLIFLDRSVPKAKGDDKIIKDYDALMARRDKALMDGDDLAFQEINEALERFDANEVEELRNAQNGGWNAYQQIKDNLVASGIPADEIRFVQEANTDEQKQALFDAVKGGRVRVLIGSTPRMGAGTNVQDRLVALHHVDVTWKPSDIEQREGRVIRQGNLFSTPPTKDKPNPMYREDFEVEIMAYATERTVDAKMWSLNATKLKAINGLRKYTGDFTMEVEDEESVSMAEMAALASGNPLLLERVTLESAINGLELQERAFRRKKYGAEDALADARAVIRDYPDRIESIRKQAKQLAAVVQEVADRADARRVTVEGKEFSTLKDALIAVKSAVDEQQAGNENARYAVSINGERLTNKAAIEDAIGRALGDVEPFEVNIGGADFTQRTAAGREAAAKLSPLAAQKDARGDLGTMFGMKVVYEFSPARFETGKVNLVLALEDGAGATVASTEIAGHDPNIQFTTSKMRDALGSLASEVESKAVGQSVSYMEDRLERARRDLPTLQERVKETFPKAQELIEKRQRLNEVVAQLTTDTPAEPDAGGDTAADDGAAPAFSRTARTFSPAAREQAVASVQAQVERIVARLANPPKVVVAFDLNDPRIPDEIRAEDQKQRSGGARGTPEGFYYRGTAYIMASQMQTPADTARVFAHEVLGHFGLRGLFGKQLRPILQQVIMSRPQEVAAKMREYGLRGVDGIDKLTAAEEVLAELAQSEPQLGLVRRAVAAIRTWLRETMPGLGGLRMSNDEIIRNFILPARDFVERGRAAAGQRMPVGRVAFLRDQGQSQTNTPEFRRWFGDSKVVDEQGKPLVVYHGTNADEDFTAFKGPKIYFSPDPAYASGYADGGMIPGFPIKNSRVMPVYLSVQKPLDLRDMGARQVERADLIKRLERAGVGADGIASIKRNTDDFPMYLWTWMHENSVRLAIQDAGFDAVFQQESNGGQTGDAFIVFKPEQIKSAIGNNGAFDPGNPDIRFSRSAPVSPRDLVAKAGDQIKMAMAAPGKLSWWHKTIGTMNNLAERNPSFKRVFQTAQAFIDDVSYYATEAADMAPKILPKLEAWRDIAKSPISAADNRAISAPIFEGTLNWARDESGKAVPVAELVEAAGRMSVDQKARRLLRQDKISEGVLKMWQGLPLDQYEQMVNSRYESQMLAPGVVWTDAELRDMWKLTPAQIDLYKEFRAATDKSLDSLTRADMLRFGGEDVADLKDAVMEAESASAAATMLSDYLRAMADADPERSAQLMASANGMIDRAERLAKLQAQGYAPLSRFGKYSVDVVVDGERQYFGLFETAMDANKMAAKMRMEFGKEAVSQGTLSNEAFKMFAGVTPETLELFGNMLGLDSTGDEVRDQLFQDYLKLTKNNRSAMKRLIHRKGIAGYSEDVGRVLASFIYSNARQTAAGLHMGELGKAVTDIPKSQGELKDEAVRLAEYIKNPQEEAQAIRGLLFAQYLGGSVASAFVNMTQPFAVSFPYLSQFGGASKAGAQMMRAIKDVASGKAGYEKDLADALKRAEEDGTVSPQEVHQLMAQARGSATLRAGDGTQLGNALAAGRNHFSRLSLAWGKVFGVAEQFNRRTTYIAAFRIAKAQGMANPAEFAKKAVQETQFIYSKANKMRWGRGAVGGTLMTFKTYSIAYLELLHRMYTQGGPEGRRAALLAVAVLMLMGGVGGLPFMEDAEDIADGIAQVFGYNVSVKKVKEEMLESVFGRAGADFIQRGISGLPGVPLDVSGRLGMGNLIPGTGAFQQKTSYTRDVSEMAGPAGDLAGRAVNAARMAVGGNLSGALLEISPVAIRNMVKGADMASTGMYRDAKGFKVIDTTGAEAALKSIGFQPSTVAKVQEANYLSQRSKDFYNLTAQRIRAKWARGVFEKDEGMVAEARAELADWNEKNPDQRMLPNMPAIMRKVREMGKSKDQRIADTAPKAMRQQMREDTARMRETL